MNDRMDGPGLLTKVMESPRTATWGKMSEVASVVGGGTPSTAVPEYFGDGIPWLTPADLSNWHGKYIAGGARTLSEEGLAASGAKLLPAGSVLMSSRAPIGYVAIARIPLCTSQGFKSFVLRGDLNPEFVFYYLQHAKELIVSMASGTTFLEISGKRAGEIPIPVPPLELQGDLVATLDLQFSRLDAAIAALKRAQANMKRYRASVLQAACEGRLVPTEHALAQAEGRDYETGEQLLERILTERRCTWTGKGKYKEPSPPVEMLEALPIGWCTASFDQLAKRVTVGFVGSMKHEYVSSGIPFLRSQNVRENRYDPKGLLYISARFHRELEKSKLVPGDLAVVRSGSVGITCVIPESVQEANCSDLVLIQSPLGFIPQYGAYVMNSVARRAVSAGTVGVALAHFNTKSVSELAVPLPPLAEQVRIVAEVERRLSVADRLAATLDANLRRATRLRQAILKKAFSFEKVAYERER